MSDIKFSIVVPCYNEASRGDFEDRIHHIQEFFEKYDDTEVIFINDGSRDDTAKVLHKMGATCYGSRINHGKGFALMLGARKSHGTYVVFMDADISVDMEMFDRFREDARYNSILICERKNRLTDRGFVRALGSIVFQDAISILFPVGVNDTQCGFKLFPRRGLAYVAPYCRCTRWFYDIELMYSLKQSGYYIKTYPVLWHSEDKSTLRVGIDSFRILVEFIDLVCRRRHLEYKY